ncbi:hypothetical protein BJ170DRAFT_589447 [Xylariales sp. AK1849]|nr:hypothetical protein BJ170DRAFT_589447 [Xylariales sp. AK1849]
MTTTGVGGFLGRRRRSQRVTRHPLRLREVSLPVAGLESLQRDIIQRRMELGGNLGPRPGSPGETCQGSFALPLGLFELPGCAPPHEEEKKEANSIGELRSERRQINGYGRARTNSDQRRYDELSILNAELLSRVADHDRTPEEEEELFRRLPITIREYVKDIGDRQLVNGSEQWPTQCGRRVWCLPETWKIGAEWKDVDWNPPDNQRVDKYAQDFQDGRIGDEPRLDRSATAPATMEQAGSKAGYVDELRLRNAWSAPRPDIEELELLKPIHSISVPQAMKERALKKRAKQERRLRIASFAQAITSWFNRWGKTGGRDGSSEPQTRKRSSSLHLFVEKLLKRRDSAVDVEGKDGNAGDERDPDGVGPRNEHWEYPSIPAPIPCLSTPALGEPSIIGQLIGENAGHAAEQAPLLANG